MALEKTTHFKFIKGILHQLHSPHPNTPDDKETWQPVEGADAKPTDLEARVSRLESLVAELKQPGVIKPGQLEREVQTGSSAKPAQAGEAPQQTATGAPNAAAPAEAQPAVVGK